MMQTIQNLFKLIFTVTICLLLQTGTASADLTSDLQGLVNKAQNLEVQLKQINLNPDSVCGPLVEANKEAHSLATSITAVNNSLTVPLQTDATLLTGIDNFSMTTLSLANEALRLSLDLKKLYGVSKSITIKDGLTSMLQLSDDIGTMADRIGEMSDKILTMSDNIGLMADRILVTQQLQNQNIALIQQGVMQTQANSLELVSIVETSTNDLSLAGLIAEGTLLTAKLNAIIFNPFMMKSQMQTAASDVRKFADKVKVVHATTLAQTNSGTSYVSPQSLLNQQNMNIMLGSLATVLDSYTIAIGGLQAITSRPTLNDSMKSMLQLSADIGLMANRILEMGDTVLAMADNIGMVADQILVTQQLQNTNIAVTQASVLGAQTFAIGVLKKLAN